MGVGSGGQSPPVAAAQFAAPGSVRQVTAAGQNGAVRISTKADYAVRAAVELAARAGDERFTKADELARAQGLPLSFLENILGELRAAGLVQTRRGAEGGYRLALPGDQITIADVVRAVEGPLASVRGEPPERVSYAGAAAPLQEVWIAVRASVRSVCERVTLADVAGGRLPDHVRELATDPDARTTRVGPAGR